MFGECKKLQSINLSNFKTNKVENMSFMFYKCIELKELDLSYFDFNNVFNMNGMFSYCSNNLKLKIKKRYNKLAENAFNDIDIENEDE